MTRLELFWARIVRANPGFGQDDSTKVTLTIGAVRKLIKKAHADGFHGGIEMSKSLDGITGTSMENILDILKGKGSE